MTDVPLGLSLIKYYIPIKVWMLSLT